MVNAVMFIMIRLLSFQQKLTTIQPSVAGTAMYKL